MPIIKGPIKFTGGFNARAFLKTKLGDMTKTSLPFTATGWKSERSPVIVENNEVEKVSTLVDKKHKEIKKKAKKLIKSKLSVEKLDKEGNVIDENFAKKFMTKVRDLKEN